MEFLIKSSNQSIIRMAEESINIAKDKYDVNKVNKEILEVLLK